MAKPIPSNEVASVIANEGVGYALTSYWGDDYIAAIADEELRSACQAAKKEIERIEARLRELGH